MSSERLTTMSQSADCAVDGAPYGVGVLALAIRRRAYFHVAGPPWVRTGPSSEAELRA